MMFIEPSATSRNLPQIPDLNSIEIGHTTKVKAIGWCLSPTGFLGYKDYHEGKSRRDDFVDDMTCSTILPLEGMTYLTLIILDRCIVDIFSFGSKPKIFFIKVLVVEHARVVWIELENIFFNKVECDENF